MKNFDNNISSAKQLHDMAESYYLKQTARYEEKAVYKKGVEAQIESAKILKVQRDDQMLIRETVEALLIHSFEQAKKQEELERIETARYYENLRFTKIAAWTGIAGFILGLCAIALQLIL